MKPTVNKVYIVGMAGALLLSAGLSWAGGLPWANLSPREQTLLQQHRRAWAGYPLDKQLQLRSGAQRYLSLEPKERRRVEQKHRQFQELSPEEQQRLRREYLQRRAR